jgi:hypothetical protein
MRALPIASFLALLPLGAALAAGTIGYGSRAGMEVTVVSMSGIGSQRAVITAKHTRANARKFCVEYEQNNSEQCIDRVLNETRLSDQITGNCRTGVFTTFYGGRFRFAGKYRKVNEGSPTYRIIDLAGGSTLDGTSASGYAYDLEQFRALCPGIVLEDY